MAIGGGRLKTKSKVPHGGLDFCRLSPSTILLDPFEISIRMHRKKQLFPGLVGFKPIIAG